jgi:NADPH:quinone reductase-like Zn-dependent oxidoreductase
MRAAGIKQTGGAVELLDVPDPRPLRRGEVLIRVVAAGVGNWDDIVRTGGWDVGRRPPMALGVEAAGIVSAVGSGVSRWAEGDQVLTHPLPLADQGTWAPWLIARATLLAEKPPAVPWATAGAFPVPALTAIQTLSVLGVQRGERVLISGAGTVTGGLMVALAAGQGVDVLATAGPSSRERVEAAGAQSRSTTTTRTGRTRSVRRRAAWASTRQPMRRLVLRRRRSRRCATAVAWPPSPLTRRAGSEASRSALSTCVRTAASSTRPPPCWPPET